MCKIEIVSPQNHWANLNHEGAVDISVNVYDSGSEVDSVRYRILGREGFNWESALDQPNWRTMQKASDWNWRTSFDPEGEENFTVVIDAYLRSGEVLHRKQSFNIRSEGPTPVLTKGVWGNLAGNMEHDPVVKSIQSSSYELAWTANAGGNIYMSSPVLKDNYVLSATFDDNNATNGYIVCWDATSGMETWRYGTKNGIKNQMVVADNKVIATDMLGVTYAIDIMSGELQWKEDLDNNRTPGFVTGLVTDGEIIYTGFSDALSALDVKSGKVLWRNNAWTGGEGTTPTMTIADDVLIASRHWGAIYGHDRFTGELIWSRSDDGLRFRDGVVSFVDGSLWVAERDGNGEGKLHKMDLKTGNTIRSFPTGMQNTGTSATIVLKDRIIIAGSHPGIASFDRESGEKIWEFEVKPALFYTPSYFSDYQQSIETTPVLAGDYIIFGAMDGLVYVLEADTGRLAWKTELGAPILTTIAPVGNGFYVCDFAGNIYSFRMN